MRFLARRVVFYLVAAWVAVTINFFIPRLLPGNPAELLFQSVTNLQPAALHAIEAEFGIGHDGTLWHQYWQYLGNLFHGNLGTSTSLAAPVSQIIGQTLPWTLVLVGTATVIAFVLGTTLGILAAWRRNGWLDRLLPGLTFLQATPYFFLALLLVDAVATHLHWFPAQRGYDFPPYVPGWDWGFIQNAIYHSILPAFTIVITTMAGWMLQMRNVMITTIGEDYVLAAQAKGLSPRRVVMAYAARNAILPQLAGFGLALGFVVSGALLMEIVFNYPGIGYQLYSSVQSDDYPMTQGIFLIIALVVLLANFVMDAVYVLADPRARTRGAA